MAEQLQRKKLPDDRRSISREFRIPWVHSNGDVDVMEIHFDVGLFDDGAPGEVWIRAHKTGSLASGSLNAAAIMISIALQHGVPLRTLTGKLRHMRFNPSGFTKDPRFPSCTSPLDLLAQWLESLFPEAPAS